MTYDDFVNYGIERQRMGGDHPGIFQPKYIEYFGRKIFLTHIQSNFYSAILRFTALSMAAAIRFGAPQRERQ